MRSRFIGAVICALALSACGETAVGPSGSSNLTIMLKDTPFSDAQAVLVTFSEVSVHRSGGDWTTLAFAEGAASRTCDLKKLVDAQDVLGVGGLEPGHYTMIRLTVSDAALYFDNPAEGAACAPAIAAPAGASAPVEVPSGIVRLNREFELAATGTTILLDFDGDQSIRETGNGRYLMTPVITVVSVE